jgi:ABC-type polysaccharide/polyol phosphate transport system ATPase subunit
MIDLRFEDVYKRYSIRKPADASQWVRKWYQNLTSRRNVTPDFWALRGVSFEIERGQTLGIIGHNGAGKSTILKLLSKITTPSRGYIRVRGRLAALLEISAGFHPELTGRENIYLSGSILGMARAEISRKLESIIEFSGIREFMEVPVKRYSSGMYVRLGFSIAAHVEPDILLLDEVLAVGDIAFQAKCHERIAQLRKAGITMVLISHDLGAVERLCDRALLLKKGEIVASGLPRDVIAEYAVPPIPIGTATISPDHKPTVCDGLSFQNPASECIRTGDPLVARLHYCAPERLSGITINLFFWWPSGYLCSQLSTAVDGHDITLEMGEGNVEFLCPILAMQPGMYRVDVEITRNSAIVERQQGYSILRVDPGKVILGDFYMPHSCRIKN